jgi:exosome complex component RRP4
MSRGPTSFRLIVSRGHGTYVDSDEVVASVAGTIERVNKLVTVRAMRTRYA